MVFKNQNNFAGNFKQATSQFPFSLVLPTLLQVWRIWMPVTLSPHQIGSGPWAGTNLPGSSSTLRQGHIPSHCSVPGTLQLYLI